MSRAMLCVHANAFGKDVEFRFESARFSIEGGALRVSSLDPSLGDLMAFAAGVWKAAWSEDEQGQPIGLAPSPGTVARVPGPAVGSAPSDGAPASVATAASAASEAERAERSARSERIIQALSSQPYGSLASFSAAIGEAPGEVERALTAALQSKAVDSDQVADASIQTQLDAHLPDLIAQRQPKGMREIMQHLRQNAATRDCDYVQLNIWLRRNPSKRG